MKPTLKRLQSLLNFAYYIPAKKLARQMKVSLPTIYRQLASLEEAGAVLATTKVPRKKTGPTPTLYRLMKAAP